MNQSRSVQLRTQRESMSAGVKQSQNEQCFTQSLTAKYTKGYHKVRKEILKNKEILLTPQEVRRPVKTSSRVGVNEVCLAFS